MKNGKGFMRLPLLLMGVFLAFTISCDKEDDGKVLQTIPELSTTELSEFTSSTATSGGCISYEGGLAVTARGVCWSTNEIPTIDDFKTVDGEGSGSFTSEIAGLEPHKKYYLRAYATNRAGTGYGNTMTFIGRGSFTDTRDGNVYLTVVIGHQEWMAENLKYLPVVHNNSEFSIQGNSSQPGYGVYGYDGCDVAAAKSQENYTTYGVLYNWFAVNSVNVCPTGWHVPTYSELNQLIDYLGETRDGGIKLKETGTTHWNYPNKGVTNETGFTALPGGIRFTKGTFGRIGEDSYWWSGDDGVTSYAWGLNLDDGLSIKILNFVDYEGLGFSVRCLRD